MVRSSMLKKGLDVNVDNIGNPDNTPEEKTTETPDVVDQTETTPEETPVTETEDAQPTSETPENTETETPPTKPEKTEEEKKEDAKEFEKKIKNKDTGNGVNLNLYNDDMNDSVMSPSASFDDAIIKRVISGDVKMRIYDTLEKIAHEIYRHDKKLAKEVDSVTDILQKYI